MKRATTLGVQDSQSSCLDDYGVNTRGAEVRHLTEDIGRNKTALLSVVSRYLEARMTRANFFPQVQFNDPCWDIMVEIYASTLAGRRMTVSDACVGMGVSISTALRWLNYLECRGLISRQADNCDRRRTYVELSPETELAFTAYFERLTAD